MQLQRVKSALLWAYTDVERNHTLQMAAALSYYSVMALFPALIFLSAVVAFLPVSGLFDPALELMGRFIPQDGMVVVRKVFGDVVTPNRGTFLSLGLLGTLWAASGGSRPRSTLSTSLTTPKRPRPFWRTRPLAMALTLMIGRLLLVALARMIVGPHFGEWLASRIHLSQVWSWAWPYVHWMLSVSFNSPRC
jgi:membrane protein